MMKWKLVLSAWDRKVLDKVGKEISTIAKQNMIQYSLVATPNKKKLFNLLSSPHVYKTSRDQYFFETKHLIIYLGECQLSVFENLSVAHSVKLVVKPFKKEISTKYQPKQRVAIISSSKIVDPLI